MLHVRDTVRRAVQEVLQFPFYGGDCDAIYLNANGGMTFGNADYYWDRSAEDVTDPAIAVFWGDMDAAAYGGVDRANQMRWRQSASCFQVAYVAFQDNDEEGWNNTATVTLADDGEITIEYGAVLSEDILVGVFDGTHTDDRYLAVASPIELASNGTGVVFFDGNGIGPEHAGELTGQTVVFRP